ncbi:MAG: aquaporin family protein [Chitinophagaceae bacterium]|nr:MAG: aquaporin family protein [Chitinophagaceae bacterium]
MSPFTGELIGTILFTILGNGVVANVVLKETKGHNSGWIVITFGWAMAVFLGVYAATTLGGSGHLNPAVSIALAAFGDFDRSLLLSYVAAQMLGTFTGAIIVWVAYKQHFDITPDPGLKFACFSTSPAIRNPLFNSLTEVIGSFVLVFGAMAISKPSASMGTLDALPVALLVLGIGLSLGGPTGYAINPARDLGPRIAHFILPIKGKGPSDWGYAAVPVIAPVIGGLLGALAYQLVY